MDNNNQITYVPNSVLHPGAVMFDYLEFNGWSQRELSRRTGITPKTISEICNEKSPITPATALAFENVFQRPAHFWLNLQRQYDEAKARSNSSANMNKWEQWASNFPLKELKKFKLLEYDDADRSNVDTLLSFFGVSSPDSWKTVWEATNVAYRQTRNMKIRIEAIAAWTRATEIAASQIETKDFDEKHLFEILHDLRELTREIPEKSLPVVEELCANAGVAVVWVPELSQTGISGCARWLSDKKAIVGMTLRYKHDDQIWFTFFHEIAHILLHRKKYGFILDNADQDLDDKIIDPKIQKEEEEANRFAANTLIPPEALSNFILDNKFTNNVIHSFADEHKIAPGIVIGRLQREGILEHYQGNTLKQTFNWNFTQ